MAISMYHASVPVFLQLLGGLKGVIEKAEAHATAHKWEENTVLNLRLYPDMFTLARQVRQASEHAFGAGRAGRAGRHRHRSQIRHEGRGWAVPRDEDALRGQREGSADPAPYRCNRRVSSSS